MGREAACKENLWIVWQAANKGLANGHTRHKKTDLAIDFFIPQIRILEKLKIKGQRNRNNVTIVLQISRKSHVVKFGEFLI